MGEDGVLGAMEAAGLQGCRMEARWIGLGFVPARGLARAGLCSAVPWQEHLLSLPSRALDNVMMTR